MGGGSSKAKGKAVQGFAEGSNGKGKQVKPSESMVLVLPGDEWGVFEDEELGRGAYSVVKRGKRMKPSGAEGEITDVAIKCIDTLNLKLRDRKALDDEIRIMRGLDHPHIVKMLADIQGAGGMYYIVMERVEGGELFDRVVELESYSEAQARATAITLLDALRYLHAKNICHRDLKPENLLLKSKTTDSDIKIADFGFAAEANGHTLTAMCGTPGYVAPEVIKMGDRNVPTSEKAPYGLECDMWSVGVIIFVLLGGYPPFDDDNQTVLFQLIARGEFEFHDEFWADISDAAKDMIRRLLCVDAAKRCSAEEALQHPWIALSEEELISRDLKANQIALRRYLQKRKLKRVYNAVIATNRMKMLIGSITKGAQEAAAQDANQSNGQANDPAKAAIQEATQGGAAAEK